MDRLTRLADAVERAARRADALGKTPTFKPSRSGENFHTLHVDVGKVNESWKKEKHFHVGPGGEGGVKGRYERFGEFLRQGKPVGTPEVGLNRHNEITFTNGRHRFAYLRDHGQKTMPVTIPKEHVSEFKRRFV